MTQSITKQLPSPQNFSRNRSFSDNSLLASDMQQEKDCGVRKKKPQNPMENTWTTA